MLFLLVAALMAEIGCAFVSGPFLEDPNVVAAIRDALARPGLLDGPSVANKFTAKCAFAMADPTSPFGHANGSMVYDASVRSFFLEFTGVVPQFDHAQTHWEQLAVDSTMLQVSNGQCMNMTGTAPGFDYFFGWVRLAKLTGKPTIRGRTCDMYNLTVQTYNMSVCLVGDEPIYLKSAMQDMYLFDFERTANASKFVTPDVCTRPPALCGSGKVIKQNVYVSHPRNNYNITGQDVADMRGDAVFMCDDSMMWKLGGYELFSAFELTMIESYSQYTNYPPPGGRGFGGDGFHVGRETPVGIGRHGGQCEDDADWLAKLGQWLSLPPAGQCIGAHQDLGVDCTWRIDRRIKTVEMSCLFDDHKFLDLCAKAQAPFDDVREILQMALESDDVAKGGCPAVTVAQCSSHPACQHLSGDCCPHEDGMILACCTQPMNHQMPFVV